MGLRSKLNDNPISSCLMSCTNQGNSLWDIPTDTQFHDLQASSLILKSSVAHSILIGNQDTITVSPTTAVISPYTMAQFLWPSNHTRQFTHHLCITFIVCTHALPEDAHLANDIIAHAHHMRFLVEWNFTFQLMTSIPMTQINPPTTATMPWTMTMMLPLLLHAMLAISCTSMSTWTHCVH